jgi:preprotein translocase subunit SecY
MAVAALANIFRIPDLKRRVLFTLGLLVVLELGNNITVPGVDRLALEEYNAAASASGGSIFSLIDQFSGGAFTKFSIFALGVMPYITASIIFQLLTVVWPYLEQISKEGEEGRRKINQWTRYATVVICMLQAAMYCRGYVGLLSPQTSRPVVYMGTLPFTLVAMIAITGGTIFVMWLGEQITERGIGNGISLIIFANIISRWPSTVMNLAEMFSNNLITPFDIIVLLGIMVVVIMLIVLLTYGQRRITIKRGKQVVGRRQYSANISYLPIRINTGGVIPVIFASSLLMFVLMFFNMLQAFSAEREGWWVDVIAWMNGSMMAGHFLHVISQAVLIIFFCYFYAAITFNPKDVAENLQRHGVTIPGYSQGRRTEEYIDKILTRVTLSGALLLSFVAILPQVVITHFSDRVQLPWGMSDFLGGTSLIIVVGVALDTVNQIENHLTVRNYDGFRKRGRVKGRRFS